MEKGQQPTWLSPRVNKQMCWTDKSDIINLINWALKVYRFFKLQ